MTLGTFFDIRSNSLNSLRLILATVVIVSHSWPIGGFDGEPHLGTMNYGEIAVAGFFAVSGYLITGSRMNNNFVQFTRARFLRIFPAYWVCLLLTAFLAAPIAASTRGGWTTQEAIEYIYNNASLVIRQWTIGGTLDGAPRSDSWNGPVWTLMYEFACYIFIGILLSIPMLRNKWAILAVFALSTATCTGIRVFGLHDSGISAKIQNASQFLTYFLAGAVIYAFRHSLSSSKTTILTALAVAIGGIASNLGDIVAPIGIAYCCIWISARFPRMIVERIGNGSIDVSYGMYIYGWVVGQLAILVGVERYGITVLIIATVLATVPFAIASWFAIEKPALRLKRTHRPVAAKAHRNTEIQ
ncbi:acyltransferase [Rhodococcus sp. IEGM 1374]|uniref:acyltransferase family protein n=1 Tax=Rhodococcus sp. IEGM 1374 TaxID=3082221 RepID=UPI0029546916|nr:acyltransferase [Rhodococcus sp. IEGM 1374]MDV7991222.1 acyltransferase [Rhodococcus sp. IEGM 1374]